MMSFVVLVLVALCSAHMSKPEQIIKEGWLRYKNSPRFDAMQRDHGHHHNSHAKHHHECQHHQHSEHHEKTIEDAIRSGPQNTVNVGKRANQQLLDRPIRILHDTSLLTLGETYSCNTDGTTVLDQNNATVNCIPSNLLTTAKINAMKDDLIPTLDVLLQNLITIRGKFRYANLTVPSGYSCCRCTRNPEFIVIPPAYKDGAGDYDFIMMWSARPFLASSNNTLGNAGACALEDLGFPAGDGIRRFSRALLGSANINPDNALNGIAKSDEFRFNNLIRVMLHETMHALGFSKDVYKNWVSINAGDTYYDAADLTPGENVTFNTVTIRQNYFKTPQLVSAAEEHFGCNIFDNKGVPIENQDYNSNQGSNVTTDVGSHFEDRVFPDDLMAPVTRGQSIISKFLIGAIADMGWYLSNESMAELSIWGKGKGCDRVYDRCDTWDHDGDEDFCDPADYTVNNNIHCALDGKGGGACLSSNWPYPRLDIGPSEQGVPRFFDYGQANPLGGMFAFSDFCFRRDPFSNLRCQDMQNTNYIYFGGQDIVSPTSICFDIPNSTFYLGRSVFACYKHRCVKNSDIQTGNSRIQFMTAYNESEWLECADPNDDIKTVNVTDGINEWKVQCPKATTWCTPENTIDLDPVLPPDTPVPPPEDTPVPPPEDTPVPPPEDTPVPPPEDTPVPPPADTPVPPPEDTPVPPPEDTPVPPPEDTPVPPPEDTPVPPPEDTPVPPPEDTPVPPPADTPAPPPEGTPVSPPEAEPAAPTVEELLERIADPDIQDNIIHFLTTVMAPLATQATLGEPTVDGRFVRWVISLIFDHELSPVEEASVKLQVAGIIAQELETDLVKVQVDLLLTSDNAKRAVQAWAYDAIIAISGATQMVASVLLSFVVFLVMFF